jgi:hypothetical protein
MGDDAKTFDESTALSKLPERDRLRAENELLKKENDSLREMVIKKKSDQKEILRKA